MEVADAVIEELFRLLEVRGDLKVALEDCEALFELTVGESFEDYPDASERGARLYEELLKFADAAFDKFQAHWHAKSEPHTEHGAALAACALIGIITLNWEPSGTPRPSAMQASREGNKGERRDIAGTWCALVRRRVQDRESDFFKSLRRQLHAYAKGNRPPTRFSALQQRAGNVESLGLPVSTRPEKYVERPEDERQLAELLASDVGIVVVYGMPSVGKRTIVSQVLARQFPGSTVLKINGKDLDTAGKSAYISLMDAGVPYSAIGAMPLHFLREYISQPGAPHFVLIENAEKSDVISALASPNAHSKIIVTALRRLSNIDSQNQLPLGELEPDAAAQLAKLHLADVTDPDAALLAQVLGRHPMAIVLACSLIKRDDRSSVREFCMDLSGNAAAVFDGEYSENTPYLTPLYRRILIDLAAVDRQALCALQMLVILNDEDIPTGILVKSLGAAFGIPNLAHQKAITLRALLSLADRGLVTLKEVNGVSYCRVPTLTRTIIDHLSVADHEMSSVLLRKGLLEIVLEYRNSSRYNSLIELLRDLEMFIRFISYTYLTPKHRPTTHYRMLILTQFRAMEEVAAFLGDESWRVLVVAIDEKPGTFVLRLIELPDSFATAIEPSFFIQWAEPEQREVEIIFDNWPAQKGMRLVIIERSMGRHYTIRKDLSA